MRRAVYTAIFGGYDKLKPAPVTPEGVDRICFTDDAGMAAPGWEMRVEQPQHSHPCLAAKFYKALSHRVFPDHDETLWIDGSFRAMSDGCVPEVFAYLDTHPLAVFAHPVRSSIHDEAQASVVLQSRYATQPLLDQVESYCRGGYAHTCGLFATGLLARKHTAPVTRFNERWWEENCRRSYQDQLSFPFLLDEIGLTPAIFPYAQGDNPWGRWEGHKGPREGRSAERRRRREARSVERRRRRR